MSPLFTLAKSIYLLFQLTYVNWSWIDAQKTSQGLEGVGGRPPHPAEPYNLFKGATSLYLDLQSK